MYCIVADISFEETEEARDSQPGCLLVTACPLAADCPKIRVRDGIMLQPGVMSRGTRGLYSGHPVCGSPPLRFFLPACSLALHSFFIQCRRRSRLCVRPCPMTNACTENLKRTCCYHQFWLSSTLHISTPSNACFEFRTS